MSTVKQAASVTIANGQTVSNGVDLGELALVGMQLPSALTSVAITFQASHDGVTYAAITKIDGTAYTVTSAPSKYIIIPPADLAGARFLKVVGGSAEAADRNIILLLREV